MDAAGAARARRDINRVGHLVSFRRMTNTLPQTATHRADVKAAVEGYAVDELVNGVTSGTRKLVVSELDLIAAGFPVPLEKGDRVYLGKNLDLPAEIVSVDLDHREYLGCYDVVAEGA